MGARKRLAAARRDWEIRFRHYRYGATVAVLAQSYKLSEADVAAILLAGPVANPDDDGPRDPVYLPTDEPPTDRAAAKAFIKATTPPRPAARGRTTGAIGRHLDKYGYVWVTDGTRGNCRLEHRVIMEQIIGRPLLRSEAVHHKNHVKHDNRPENLELMTRSAHTAHHNHIEPKRKKGEPPKVATKRQRGAA